MIRLIAYSSIAFLFMTAAPAFPRDAVRGARPIWVIEHQCNSVGYLAEAVRDHRYKHLKVNAVECDISYRKGLVFKESIEEGLVYHPAGVDVRAKMAVIDSGSCSRYTASAGIDSYLDAMSSLSLKYSNYCLHYFDIKTSGLRGMSPGRRAAKGLALLRKIKQRVLDKGSPLYIIVNVGDPAYIDFVAHYPAMMNSNPLLAERIGVIIDGAGSASRAVRAFESVGLPVRNRWYANGIDGMLSRVSGVLSGTIIEGVRMRSQGKLAGVCQWTVNKEPVIGLYLKSDVNGIMADWYLKGITGDADYGVITALRLIDANPALFRLADRNDNPFRLVPAGRQQGVDQRHLVRKR